MPTLGANLSDPASVQALQLAAFQASGMEVSAAALMGIAVQHRRTPEYYGCVGDVRYIGLTASIASGSAVLTSPNAAFTLSDVGKTVMVAGAGTPNGGATDLVTTVASYQSATQVTLSANAGATVSAVAMHIGTDDGPNLQAWLDGCAALGYVADLPSGRTYLAQQMPLRYSANAVIDLKGNILFGSGWGGSFGICDKQFGVVSSPVMGGTTNVFIRGLGGVLIMSPAGVANIGGTRRKGIGMCYTDRFEMAGIRVQGITASERFAMQAVSSRRGMVWGAYPEMQNTGQGSDGWHAYGACSDIQVYGVNSYSGDDGSSQTLEGADVAGATLERIQYFGCTFRNIGHSGAKVYINVSAVSSAGIIQDIDYHNCAFITECDPTTGDGAPISIYMDGYSGYVSSGVGSSSPPATTIIRRIKFFGGTSTVLNPKAGIYGPRAIRIVDASNVEFYGHTLNHSYATALFVQRVNKFVWKDCTITHTQPPQTVVSGLSIASVAWQSGNTVRYTFSAAISGVTTSQYLIPSGLANADNNYSGRITNVGTNYVDVTNYRRADATLDEASPSGATAYTVFSNPSSIILWDCTDPLIQGGSINSPIGSAAVTITGSSNDTTHFTDGAKVLDLQVNDQLYGQTILNANAKNTTIKGVRTRRCQGDCIITEGNSAQAAAGGHIYEDNIDLDARSSSALRLSNSVPGKKTSHRGNFGRTSDSLSGTATQASGATSFTIPIPNTLSTDNGALIDETYFNLSLTGANALGGEPAKSWNASTRILTVTTPAAPAALTWKWQMEMPRS